MKIRTSDSGLEKKTQEISLAVNYFVYLTDIFWKSGKIDFKL